MPGRAGKNEGSHVVVLGAGMAGLAAAGAAAAEVGRVTVVDRDELPHDARPRRSVPQSRHIHALLAGGLQALEELLPGFDARLGERGAREVTHGGGFGFRGLHGWLQEVPELRVRCTSRPVIETTARELVRDRANVEILEDWQVNGLRTDPTGRIDGVIGTHGGRPDELSADLVVDATGRGSVAPSWLTQLGRQVPRDRVVDAGLWYASTTGDGRPDLPGSMEAFVMLPTKELPAGGGVIPTGDGSYVVSCSATGDREPPRTVAAMHDHARSLSSPLLARALATLDLDDDIVHSRSTANRVRRYDQIDLPQGLVLIGDSICALDPAYGQGMTVSAVQAVCLRDLLSDLGVDHPGFTAQFQERAWGVAKLAWDQAVAADQELPTVDLSTPLLARPLVAYIRRVSRLCTIDPDVALRVGRVMHMLDPPSRLFHPALIARVTRDLVRPADVPTHPADQPVMAAS